MEKKRNLAFFGARPRLLERPVPPRWGRPRGAADDRVPLIPAGLDCSRYWIEKTR